MTGTRALCMALQGGFLRGLPRFASDAGSNWVYGEHIWIAGKPPVLVAILMGSIPLCHGPSLPRSWSG